ncbi:MAG: glutamate 5-kinase [Actinomycetia bacterium]|nr:glutamate 5-kinase [Actinomycetes bacterium]
MPENQSTETCRNPRTVVVKVGSNTLTDERGSLNRRYIASLADQIADLMHGGVRVVLVTSAAIAAGLEVLGWSERPTDIDSLQAAASIGQAALLDAYAAEFGRRGIPVGQILLTRYDLEHEKSYANARNAFERLMALGALPLVNENDATAVDEIRYGDNDTLAALVGKMISAERVIFLTDVDGLYDANPAQNADARRYERLDHVDDELLAAAPEGDTGSAIGSGGMRTKVQAAAMLLECGIETVICDGRRGNVVRDCLEGSAPGTVFCQPDSEIGDRS